MKKVYITGVNNYTTHDEASRHYYRCESKVALGLRKDGSASISWLQHEPMYKGQAEYNPIGCDVKYNFERN